MLTLKTIKSGDPVAKDIDILMYDNGYYSLEQGDDRIIFTKQSLIELGQCLVKLDLDR